MHTKSRHSMNNTTPDGMTPAGAAMSVTRNLSGHHVARRGGHQSQSMEGCSDEGIIRVESRRRP
jgi:hypothetical protein